MAMTGRRIKDTSVTRDRAACGDPGGGEIPMRQNALPEGAFPVLGRRGQIRTKQTIDTEMTVTVLKKQLRSFFLIGFTGTV